MSDQNQDINTNVSLSGQIAVPMIVLIFVLFITSLILYLCYKGYSGTTGSFSYRSSRLSFAHHEPTLPRLALDPSILNSLPITIFRSKNFKGDGICECAVCICELCDGEKIRLLPKCNHCFHVECIDMWFHSNNTCPLCRCLLTEITDVEMSVQIPIEPLTAVLETGDTSMASSSSSSRKRNETVLAINIPRPIANGFSSANTPLGSSKVPSNSPLPTSRLLEEIKSPTAGFGRMRSLKRMLSGGSFKGAGSSHSPPIGCDIEQGGLADSKCQ